MTSPQPLPQPPPFAVDAEPARRGWRPVELAVGGVVAAVLVTRLVVADTHWLLWADRDLWRAAHVLQDWTTSGAELSYGGGARIPGGAWAWLLALPLAFGADAQGVVRTLLGIETVGILALAAVVARTYGRTAGLLVAAAYALDVPARLSMVRLWNPTAVPPFVLLALALLVPAVTRGRRWAWAGAGLALAVATQCHLTAGALAVWLLGALLVLRPRPTARGLGPFLGAALLAYLPHLVDEAVHGFGNTRLVLAQGPVTRAADRGVSFEEMGLAIQAILPTSLRDVPALPGTVPITTALVGLGFVAGAVTGVARRRTPEGALLVAVTVATTMVTLHAGLDGTVGFEDRYLLAVLPGLALVVGVGLARGVDALGARLPAAAGLGGLAVAAALLVPQALRATEPRSDLAFVDGPRTFRALDEIVAETGLSLADVVGRLYVVEEDDGRYRPLKAFALEYPLWRAEGRRFEGSLPPPCLAALTGLPKGVEPGAAELAQAMRVAATDVTVTASHRLDPQAVLLTYTPPWPLCPVLTTDRYVDGDVDALARPLWDTLGPGETAELPAPDGTRRIAALVEPERDTRALLVLDLVPGPGALAATLHGPQLRGLGLNGGWFADRSIGDVHLVLEPVGGAAPVDVGIYADVIGTSGVAPPIRTGPRPVPPGRYTARLRLVTWAIETGAEEWPLDPAAAIPVEVPLPGEVVVAP